MSMNGSWIVGVGLGLVVAGSGWAQGIRGVTRRTPNLVAGQTASQFFAAGGLPLNPVNPALATVPGGLQGIQGGGRGLVAAPPVPASRTGQGLGWAQGQRPVSPPVGSGASRTASTPSPVRWSPGGSVGAR